MTEDVLVIGAGPAGIASAYYLEQAGISYVVVDSAYEIATTWNSLYPSLKLNTSRFFSHLPGKRFPLRWGLFPMGKQYHHYVVEFARERDFNVRLGVTVTDIQPDGDRWRVETSEGTFHYAAVISATGRFGSPWLPDVPGMAEFSGDLIHAQDYLGPEPYIGKRVMVVGNGPSGVDIATELGRTPGVVEPVLLSQRTGVVLRPRYPWGLPKHLWIIIGEMLPRFIGERLINRISSLRFKNLNEIGIKSPRTDEESSAAGGTRGHELIEVVQAGRVKSVDGPARFDGHSVELRDGTTVEVDAVIMGTGYRPVIERYFKQPYERDSQDWPMRVEGDHDRFDTGKRQVAGYPGLYLVGVWYTGKGAMYNFNTEAEAAVKEIQARLRSLERSPAAQPETPQGA